MREFCDCIGKRRKEGRKEGRGGDNGEKKGREGDKSEGMEVKVGDKKIMNV